MVSKVGTSAPPMRGRAHSALRWRTALLLAALLGLCQGTAGDPNPVHFAEPPCVRVAASGVQLVEVTLLAGLQVFLTRLRLLSGSHRLRIEGGMTIYMRCDSAPASLAALSVLCTVLNTH